MNPDWVTAIENSFQATPNSGSWFQGYSTAAQECAWFGYRTYQDYATIILFIGYGNGAIAKGYRDGNSDEWNFYWLYGHI